MAVRVQALALVLVVAAGSLAVAGGATVGAIDLLNATQPPQPSPNGPPAERAADEPEPQPDRPARSSRHRRRRPSRRRTSGRHRDPGIDRRPGRDERPRPGDAASRPGRTTTVADPAATRDADAGRHGRSRRWRRRIRRRRRDAKADRNGRSRRWRRRLSHRGPGEFAPEGDPGAAPPALTGRTPTAAGRCPRLLVPSRTIGSLPSCRRPNRPRPTSSRAPATVRVAMWSARHRWPVVGLWFLATDRPVRRPAWRWAGSTRPTPTPTRTSGSSRRARPTTSSMPAASSTRPSSSWWSSGAAPARPPIPRSRPPSRRSSRQLHGASRRDRWRHQAELRPAGRPIPGAAGRRAGLAGRERRSGSRPACPGDDPTVHALLAPVRPIVDAARAANPTCAIHADQPAPSSPTTSTR